MVQLLVFGIVGVLMKLFNIPAAPAVLGLVLAPLHEMSLRRTMNISGGDFGWLAC